MARAIRSWFCIAAAVIASAIADPIVESASNHGLFGRGNFTDHSSLDIVPALVVGIIFALLAVALRVRNALTGAPDGGLLVASDRALRAGSMQLIPLAFVLQIAALYSMETIEQAVVYGHVLGGMLWLGGPAIFSISAHALACVAVVCTLSRAISACARATLGVIGILRAFAGRRVHGSAASAARRKERAVREILHCAFCRLGERAPPLLIA